MKPINEEPIHVDFNNLDEDTSVRIYQPLKSIDLKREFDIKLKGGEYIWVSDGEIEIRGTVESREHLWVVVPDDEGFKDVDPNSPYHIKNVSRE